MSLRRGLSAIVMVLLIVGQIQQLTAGNCRGSVSGDAIRTGGSVASDGKVHYTVGYGYGVSNAHKAAIQHAMNLWNDQQGDSGIVLVEATGGLPDFEFRRSTTTNPTVCAAYEEGGSYIWFSESLMAFAVNEPQLAGRVYAHELGHALGLAHKGTGSIMNTALHGTQTCRQGAQQLPSSVWNEDASDAHDCERTAHANTRYGPPPSYFWQQWFPTCQTTWLREEYWVCPDGCFLDFIIDILYWTNC